jgi:serine/threonine protein kinase/formylglycine-generating enzyme required for sulfatase activity
MSDSERIPPNDSAAKTPVGTDDGALPATESRTFIGDTKSRSGSQPDSKSEAVGVGTKLGPYELVRKLGQGGMGAVYEARHTKLNKTFALKVLPPGFASNEAAVTRFEREMQAIGQLDHPHIIKATDAGEWNGTHILVMEYVEGTDLSVLVKTRGPLSVRDACKAIRQAALGLQHAHEHGLVHRDIKPSNLFVTKSGQIKLLDLGLARLGDDGEQQRGLTSVGQILGTPDYMAPEQWDDTHSVDARADLYSLGCTLCFVLTGRAPYADVTKSSLLQLMKAHVEGAIPNLTDIRLDVPPELNAIFVRLLAKQAEDRYPNAAEVIAALEPFTRKGADGSTLTSKPVFAPGKEPPTAHAAPSTSKGQAGRDSERSVQRSIKSLSASSTDDAFASDRPMIHGDSSASLAETIIQPRAATRLHRRWPLIIGLSGLVLALLIGIAISNRPKGDGASVGQSLKSEENSAPNQVPIEASSTPKVTPRPGWHGWPADAPKPAIAPFDMDQAKKHQDAWAGYLKLPVEYTNSIGMEFRLIPPGEYLRGTGTDDEDKLGAEYAEIVDSVTIQKSLETEKPQHRVILRRPRYVAIHEVTQRQYEMIAHANPSFFATTGGGAKIVQGMDTKDFPVENLPWTAAAKFCITVSQNENLATCYNLAKERKCLEADGYRMLTDAEWEFACRAGTNTRFWSGDDTEALVSAGWSNSNAQRRTHPVGELLPNPFGLYDMAGNVGEHCHDHSFRYEAVSAAIDPVSNGATSPNMMVCRGGHYYVGPFYLRSAVRNGMPIDSAWGTLGFRVSLSVDAVRDLIGRSSPSLPAVKNDASPADAPKPNVRE